MKRKIRASSNSTLFLDSTADMVVKVSPVVLFGVLDHHLRRPEGQERVIGTLLGVVNANVVEVRNSFAVPHLEKDDEVAVGKDFNRQMFALHQMVNPKEQILGWYATSFKGADIADNSSLIHEFYTSECDNPVHLVVDTSLAGSQVGVRAYLSTPVMLAGAPIANMFHQVCVEQALGEAERSCLDRMAGEATTGPNAASALALVQASTTTSTSSTTGGGGGGGPPEVAVGSVQGELAALHSSMEKLSSLLDNVTQYVEGGRGDKGTQEALGRQIAQTLSTVPRIRPQAFEKLFTENVQDLLMVSYLTNLTKTQLQIAEKLHESIGS
eukprot:CAMPEP_0113936510 /NCGR_PEP_ID=MMETSP1339-20121228/3409_1 /TAXON_ID=94617 /ORGANISM="Fibrocapsa japonica" /LENGTH=325 /DNA_ID=CAMNT_0000939019 /DNA_START=210 /DNA_END=1187 /DNA_ORIENTATION=- /assembly_acc=CAM_ASM_000762